MRTFLELALSAAASQREALIPSLVEYGCGGFEETDAALLCYFDVTADASGSLRERLAAFLRGISPNLAFTFREMREENWNEQWERGLLPVEVGKRFVVKPSWTAYENRDGRILLTIDPKMAFGTGYHESTRLILGLLEEHLPAGAHFLDVGTGTGILAIAALKLGAARAAGIDNDPWAIDNARENAAANGVTLEISDTPPENFPAQSFTAIAANLMLTTIREMLGSFHLLLRPGGLLLLAGLLESDAPRIEEALRGASFAERARVHEHEWIAIAARRVP